MRDIGKASRRPHRFARCRFACATGTAASQGFRTASRMACDAPHRHATRVLAESLGKPSLWVIIKDLWYYVARVDLERDPASPSRQAVRR